MSKMLIIGMVAAVLAWAGAAYAYPTLTGPTGTGVLPTAAVAANGLNLAADYYNNRSDTGTFGNTYPIRLQFGIGGVAEVGALYDVRKDLNTWGANAKFASPMRAAGFALAVGAQYDQTNVKVTGLNGKTRSSQVSLEGTRAILKGNGAFPGLALTLGANWTRRDISDVNVTVNGKEDAIRGFACLEASIAKLALDVDYQTRNSKLDTKSLGSVALRVPIMGGWAAQVGFTNAAGAGLSGSDSYRLFAGVNFGMGK